VKSNNINLLLTNIKKYDIIILPNGILLNGGDTKKMNKEYYYNYQYSIARAMCAYNARMKSKHFALIDAHILSLIKSFYDNNQDFYMTNAEIAKVMLVNESTIKRSITKLCDFGLILKEALGNRRFDGRRIVYCKNSFIADNNTDGFKVYASLADKFYNHNINTNKDKFSLIDISVASLGISFSGNNQFFYMLNHTMQDLFLVSQPIISKSIKLLEKYGVAKVTRPTKSLRSIIFEAQ